MLSITAHREVNRSVVRRTHRPASTSVRIDGHEHVRSHPGAAALAARVPRQTVHVPAAQSHRTHPQVGDLPPRHQA